MRKRNFSSHLGCGSQNARLCWISIKLFYFIETFEIEFVVLPSSNSSLSCVASSIWTQRFDRNITIAYSKKSILHLKYIFTNSDNERSAKADWPRVRSDANYYALKRCLYAYESAPIALVKAQWLILGRGLSQNIFLRQVHFQTTACNGLWF